MHHAITFVAKRVDNEFADKWIVLDDENSHQAFLKTLMW